MASVLDHPGVRDSALRVSVAQYWLILPDKQLAIIHCGPQPEQGGFRDVLVLDRTGQIPWGSEHLPCADLFA